MRVSSVQPGVKTEVEEIEVAVEEEVETEVVTANEFGFEVEPETAAANASLIVGVAMASLAAPETSQSFRAWILALDFELENSEQRRLLSQWHCSFEVDSSPGVKYQNVFQIRYDGTEGSSHMQEQDQK